MSGDWDPTDPAREQKFDSMFRCAYDIDIAHHEIHSGDAFVLGITTADLSANNIGIRFVTPAAAAGLIHMVVKAESTEDARILFVEGGTGGGGGAATPLNRERNSANTSGLTAVNSGTVTTSGGTALIDKYWGTDGVGNRNGIGAGERGTNEFVLKAATAYQVVLSGAGDKPAWVELDWYKHISS